MMVRPQTLLHQRVGWRLKGNYEVLAGVHRYGAGDAEDGYDQRYPAELEHLG
jgi:hypothetical protein